MANINSIKLPDGVTYNVQDTVSGYTTNVGTVTGVKVNGTTKSPSSGIVDIGTVVTSETDPTVPSWAKASTKPSYSASEISGLGTAAAKNSTTSVTSGSADLVTSGAVYTAIANLPEPMVFKGTLGTGGTITSLPTASTANEGFTYKVITSGSYASQAAKVGDLFISNGSAWVLVPSGDDTATDTWRNIKINGTEKIGTAISTGAVDFVNGTNTTVSYTASGNKVAINATDTKYTATTTSIGSASAGTAIAADDITAWSANTPTSCTISQGVLTFTAGSAASLSYTARSIPNISVTSKTVATGITAS